MEGRVGLEPRFNVGSPGTPAVRGLPWRACGASIMSLSRLCVPNTFGLVIRALVAVASDAPLDAEFLRRPQFAREAGPAR